MKSLIISLHDVAPASANLSRQWMKLFNQRGVKVSMLVIPGPWRKSQLTEFTPFTKWLAEEVKLNHEVVLHGWEHKSVEPLNSQNLRSLIGRIAARGCEEFWCLDYEQASERIVLGQSKLENLGHRPIGFIAPGWMSSKETINALQDLEFDYTTSHLQIKDLYRERKYFAPVLCQRSNTKASKLIARATVLLSRILCFARLPIRVAVHPDDLLDTNLRFAILEIISLAIKNGYKSVTYGSFIKNIRRQNEFEFRSKQITQLA